MTATIPAADLLRHAGWVHALARALSRDEHRAADLAQQTWVTVLEHPPLHSANLRGFLGAVVRNLWRQDRRATARRRRREQEAEPSLPVSSTADVVARAAAQRTVVDAVLLLDEPYRGTVLLRFFDGWSVRRIAEHQQVPVATVRTRLQRALRRLRNRLGQRHERGLAAFLMPFLSRPRSWLLLPLLAMKTKLTIGLGVAAATIILLAVQYLPEGPAPAGPQPGGGSGAPVTASARGSGAAASGEAAQRSVVPSATEPVAKGAKAVAAVVVTGSLRTSEDLPLAGRRVVFVTRGERIAVATGADGAFSAAVEEDGRFEIEEAGWTTVFTALVAAAAPPRHALVVAAEAVRVAGVVVDEQGAGVAQAAVAVVLPDGFRTRFRDNADAAAVADWRGVSDAEGRFEIHAAPAIAMATLLSTQPSFLPDRRELPLHGDPALRVVLRRAGAADGALQGQVVDAGGRAVAGAWVGSGEVSARADEQGNFALAGGGGAEVLAASKAEAPVRLVRPEAGWPPFLLVRLGSAPLRISGRVLDGEGKGVMGVKVWVTNGTPFGGRRASAVVEGLASGSPTREELEARIRAQGAPADPGEALRNTPMALWPWTRSGEGGSFTLDGLFDRAYDLRAMRDDNLLWTDQAAVAAGSTGVELRLPADGTFAEISGRVVNFTGAPVPNVRIAPMCDTVRVGGSTIHAQATAVRTGDDGRFRLLDVPKLTAYLRLDGEQILPLEHGRGVPGGLLELLAGIATEVTITVRQRMHVQVELTDPTTADGLEVHDATGKQLMIDVFEGRSRNTIPRLPFAAGRTPVFVVPDTATTLILRLHDREVRRETLALVGGDVNRLRY